MIGAAGNVILFVILGVLQVIVGAFVLSYSAHTFLSVVESTAAGSDDISGSKEPFVDWIWKAVYLAWLVGVWLVPAELFLRATDPALLEGHEALGYLIVATVGLWLLFPIGLLSSLSANSRWIPFRLTVLRGLLRGPGTLLIFYCASAVVLATCATCFYRALGPGSNTFVLMSGSVGAAGMLIHARLLGRLAGILRRVQLPVAKALGAKQRRVKPRREIIDPWAVPADELNKRMQEEGPVVSIPLDGPVESYGVAEDRTAKRTRNREDAITAQSVPFDGPAEPYEVAADAPERTQEPPTIRGRARGGLPVLIEPSAEEMELARPRCEPPLPRLPFVSAVYTFPWHWNILPVWGLVAVGLMLMQWLFLLQQQFWPG